MTKKYERQCWYCGSKNMERLSNHVKCLDCGATWNVVPKLGQHSAEPGNAIHIRNGEPVPQRSQHPTKTLQRRAAIARRKKGG